jgi:hypothetical protein
MALVNTVDDIASNETVIGERWVGKDVEAVVT